MATTRSRRPDVPLDETAIGFVVNGTRMRLGNDNDVDEAIRRLAAHGVTFSDAAWRLHMSPGAVRTRAGRLGVRFRPDVEPAHWTFYHPASSANKSRRRHLS